MHGGARDQVLREVADAVADRADAVVRFEVHTPVHLAPDEPRHGRVRRSGAQTLLTARESEPHHRQDRKPRLFAVTEQADLRAELRVAKAVDVGNRLVTCEQPIRRHTHFDTVGHADTDQRGRAERANIWQSLPLHAQLELNFTRRDDVGAGADVRTVSVNGGLLGAVGGIDCGLLDGQGEREERDGGCHCGKS